MEGRKNGVACTIVRVIQIKNAFSRRVAVNVRTVLLLVVKIAENMKPLLYTAQPLTASRAAVVTVNFAKKANEESEVEYSPPPGIGFSFACCHPPLSHQVGSFQMLVDSGSSKHFADPKL